MHFEKSFKFRSYVFESEILYKYTCNLVLYHYLLEPIRLIHFQPYKIKTVSNSSSNYYRISLKTSSKLFSQKCENLKLENYS